MKMENPRPSQIKYLVNRKFGLLPTVTIRTQTSPADSLSRNQERERYTSELEALSDLEIMKIYSETRAIETKLADAAEREREAKRIYNQPDAALNVEYWSKLAEWELPEAVAISMAKNPEVVTLQRMDHLVGVSDFAREYKAKLKVLERARDAGQISFKNAPSDFLIWAARWRFKMPEEVVQAVQELHALPVDWKQKFHDELYVSAGAHAEITSLLAQMEADRKAHLTEMSQLKAQHAESIGAIEDKSIRHLYELSDAKGRINELEVRIEELEANKASKPQASLELGTRPKETLLKMLIGMAMDGYGYKPAATRSPFSGELSNVLSGLGLNVTDDTIRKYIRDAAELLPGKPPR